MPCESSGQSLSWHTLNGNGADKELKNHAVSVKPPQICLGDRFKSCSTSVRGARQWPEASGSEIIVIGCPRCSYFCKIVNLTSNFACLTIKLVVHLCISILLTVQISLLLYSLQPVSKPINQSVKLTNQLAVFMSPGVKTSTQVGVSVLTDQL